MAGIIDLCVGSATATWIKTDGFTAQHVTIADGTFAGSTIASHSWCYATFSTTGHTHSGYASSSHTHSGYVGSGYVSSAIMTHQNRCKNYST